MFTRVDKKNLWVLNHAFGHTIFCVVAQVSKFFPHLFLFWRVNPTCLQALLEVVWFLLSCRYSHTAVHWLAKCELLPTTLVEVVIFRMRYVQNKLSWLADLNCNAEQWWSADFDLLYYRWSTSSWEVWDSLSVCVVHKYFHRSNLYIGICKQE